MMRRLLFAVSAPALLCRAGLGANSCSAFASGVSFGSYYGSVVDITGTVTVTCTSGQAYDIALNAGLASGATITTRSMQNGSALLGYKLFSDSARTSTGATHPAPVGSRAPAMEAPSSTPSMLRFRPGETGALQAYTDTPTASISGTGITTVTAQFSVTATIVKDCTVSATNLAFGNYTGAVNNSTSTVSVNCTSGTAYTVGLSAGLATGATVTTRKMQNWIGVAELRPFHQLRSHHQLGNTSATNWVSGTGTGPPKGSPSTARFPQRNMSNREVTPTRSPFLSPIDPRRRRPSVYPPQ